MPAAPIHLDLARLAANVRGVRAAIAEAQARGEHAAADVTLVAVTKSMPPPIFEGLVATGVMDVGENQVQQAVARRLEAPEGLRWHGIGPLQRNKAKPALETFDVLHAMDRLPLAERLQTLLAEGEGEPRRLPVYLQVNASLEPQKAGVAPEAALDLLRSIQVAAPLLDVVGWMSLGKAGAGESDLRATFRTLRGLRDEARRLGVGNPPPAGLSMGMSDDYTVAIEEGATVVRVGRALFRGVLMEA